MVPHRCAKSKSETSTSKAMSSGTNLFENVSTTSCKKVFDFFPDPLSCPFGANRDQMIFGGFLDNTRALLIPCFGSITVAVRSEGVIQAALELCFSITW